MVPGISHAVWDEKRLLPRLPLARDHGISGSPGDSPPRERVRARGDVERGGESFYRPALILTATASVRPTTRRRRAMMHFARVLPREVQSPVRGRGARAEDQILARLRTLYVRSACGRSAKKQKRTRSNKFGYVY